MSQRRPRDPSTDVPGRWLQRLNNWSEPLPRVALFTACCRSKNVFQSGYKVSKQTVTPGDVVLKALTVLFRVPHIPPVLSFPSCREHGQLDGRR